MKNNRFLGVGIKFPPEIDNATGRFQMSGYEDDIRQSIYLILMTMKGERVERPEFGSQMNRYVFEQMDLTTITMMENEISYTIEEQEPRVKNVVADVVPDEGSKLNINIGYVVADTNRSENMVFPFYINSGGGAPEYERK